MWNMKEVAVGAWAPGMPSINRTANCLAINRFGHFMEESCYKSGRRYYTLCEAQTFDHGIISDIEINRSDFNNAKINDHNAETETDNQLIQQQLQALTPIGTVGNRTYFADDQEVSLVIIN